MSVENDSRSAEVEACRERSGINERRSARSTPEAIIWSRLLDLMLNAVRISERGSDYETYRAHVESAAAKEASLLCELLCEFANARADMLRAAEAKLKAIGQLLEANGCDCECDHHFEEHDSDCERCLACRIGGVL